jgi:hypothetical protein
MSRSKRRSKQFKEWWGKRPYSDYPVSNRSKTNKFFKRQVHKVERQQGKDECDL